MLIQDQSTVIASPHLPTPHPELFPYNVSLPSLLDVLTRRPIKGRVHISLKLTMTSLFNVAPVSVCSAPLKKYDNILNDHCHFYKFS